jgi:hypothetical protein
MLPLCCCPTEGGFKLVTAMVNWFGFDGFDMRDSEGNCPDVDIANWTVDPCPGSVCNGYTPYSPHPKSWKYLQYNLEIRWSERSDRVVVNPPCPEPDSYEQHDELNFQWSKSVVYNRFSGVTTTDEDIEWNTTSTGNPSESLTGSEALAAFYARNPPYGFPDSGTGYGYSLDAMCGHAIQVEPRPSSSYTLVGPVEITDDSITILCEFHNEAHEVPVCLSPPGSGTDDLVASGTFTVHITLSDKFTSAEVFSLAKGLLALADLSDDTWYPWRTGCSGLSYNYGALITFDYNGYGPNGDGSILGGYAAGETWYSGAHAWLGHSPEGIAGASVFYFNTLSEYTEWLPNSLLVSKWAEKKVALPAHNYARPCGEDYWATESEVRPDYWAAHDPPIVDVDVALCWDPGQPTGKLNTNGVNVAAGFTVEIGSKAYQFIASLTPVEGEVLIGADADASMTNLKNAINYTGTPGTDYSCAAAHPEVTAAFTTPVLTVTSIITATLYSHLYTTTTSDTTWTWAHTKVIGPECADPCNNTTSTGDYTTEEQQWDIRGYGEANRMNNYPTVCPLAEGATADGSPCTTPGGLTVPLLWDTTCTQRDATAGTIICCSPTDDFGGLGDYYPFPASLTTDSVEGMCDETYGYLWYFHIRQVMPDPLITCLGLYPFNAVSHPNVPVRLNEILMEEARCTEGSCPALPATPPTPIFFCPDSDTNSTGDCGSQDDYGMQCPPL